MTSASLSDQIAGRGIGWADDWLDLRTCRRLTRELEHVHWRRSQVVAQTPDGLSSRDSVDRTSRSASARWFSPSLRRVLEGIEERLVAELGVEPSHLEGWQAVAYEQGGRFGTHHDGGHLAGQPGGERVLTFLLCVRAPASGGATYFPDLDLLLDPRPGRLAVWRNLDPDGALDPRMRHAATPVHEGRKTMLTTWSRQRPLR